MKSTIHFQGQTIGPQLFEDGVLRSITALQARGVGTGAGACGVVALMLTNSPQYLELNLAVRHLGAQWCPVNWHFKAEEVAYILRNSGAGLWIVKRELLDALQLDPAALPPGLQVVTDEEWARERTAAAPSTLPAQAPRGAMFYTSGTTGLPKGIQRAAATPEQATQSRIVARTCMGFDLVERGTVPQIRALVNAPMYHSAPNGYSLMAALEGAEIWIEERFDAERTLQLIHEHRLTHAYLVPTMYVRMLRLPEETKRQYDVRSMRFVSSTGSPCPPAVKKAMIDWWGPCIHESYGASELGYMTLLTPADAIAKPGSAGRPLTGCRIEIRDDTGALLPVGQAGAIYAHHPAYSDFTYVGNDAARRKMDIGGVKTLGDVGYLDEDGFLFIVDRKADMVISGGVNIYPAEIEAALQLMPGVVDCAVFGIPDEEFGEALACAVQTSPNAVAAGAGSAAALTAESVQHYLRGKLASYKVPRTITFHDALPREDTGKIFKRKLREPYWAGRDRRV
jgi:long-chain acyl-CoA synthetase